MDPLPDIMHAAAALGQLPPLPISPPLLSAVDRHALAPPHFATTEGVSGRWEGFAAFRPLMPPRRAGEGSSDATAEGSEGATTTPMSEVTTVEDTERFEGRGLVRVHARVRGRRDTVVPRPAAAAAAAAASAPAAGRDVVEAPPRGKKRKRSSAAGIARGIWRRVSGFVGRKRFRGEAETERSPLLRDRGPAASSPEGSSSPEGNWLRSPSSSPPPYEAWHAAGEPRLESQESFRSVVPEDVGDATYRQALMVRLGERYERGDLDSDAVSLRFAVLNGNLFWRTWSRSGGSQDDGEEDVVEAIRTWGPAWARRDERAWVFGLA